jgi:hypothetical protein
MAPVAADIPQAKEGLTASSYVTKCDDADLFMEKDVYTLAVTAKDDSGNVYTDGLNTISFTVSGVSIK